MSFTQRCISNQHHVNIPVESIPGIPHHTTQNGFKSKRISPHFTHSRLNLKIWKCEGWAWANYKAFHKSWRQRHHEQPLEQPLRTQKAFTPSSPMELKNRLMIVTEVFIFKASASAWPKGKRHGSRSRSDICETSWNTNETQLSSFRLWVSKEQFPLDQGFRANVVYSEVHSPATYHANIPVESTPHHTTQN